MEYAESARALIVSGAVGGPEATRHPRWLGFLPSLDRQATPLDFSPERTSDLLREYGALLRRAGEGEPGRRPPEDVAVGTSIRETGRRITQIAERLSSQEGRNIQEMLRSGRSTLVFLVVLFLVGTAIIARMVLLTAIRPLKELETGMQRIASGDLQFLPEGSGSAEISSMHTAFNRMIRELAEHRREMVQSERLASLGTMLAGIAHEINNPLSNISTSAELLREENEDEDPEQRRELIDQIISQTDRATRIIRTVLDFSREPRFERRSTNLLSTIREAVVLVRGEMPAHVSVEVEVAPDLEVLADKAKLQQAFINVVTNAIDALRGSDRQGRIAVAARPAGERHVEIAFRDTGAGIPAHLLDRIFDPFFTTKEVGRGTGLGLYLTHQIVEQHAGTMRVESTVGEGTTITLRLPRPERAPTASVGDLRTAGGA
jgi:signal transduction histidine kinase